MITAQESITAKLCSFARAYHSTMGQEKIFDDYLAYDIIGREEYARLEDSCARRFQRFPQSPDMVLRTSGSLKPWIAASLR